MPHCKCDGMFLPDFRTSILILGGLPFDLRPSAPNTETIAVMKEGMR